LPPVNKNDVGMLTARNGRGDFSAGFVATEPKS
jgi:hypothetical protein